MWKIFNFLFGWDYIAWRDIWGKEGISRVYIDGSEEPYYWESRLKKSYYKIVSEDKYLWLTCPPSKYLKQKIQKEG